MSPRRPDILALEWDDENEDHILRHILPDLVDEMIENGDWYAFENTSGHPPERRKIIGRTSGGAFVTAIVTPSTTGHYGTWRPVTAWHSTDYERERYQQLRHQGGR
jgi:uncharacterized DUF497 family protein